MKVVYTVQGAVSEFDLLDVYDLRSVLLGIEEQLRATHPELAASPQLPIQVNEGVLMSLAEDRDTIELGELA